jgi:hypothetical protein
MIFAQEPCGPGDWAPISLWLSQLYTHESPVAGLPSLELLRCQESCEMLVGIGAMPPDAMC